LFNNINKVQQPVEVLNIFHDDATNTSSGTYKQLMAIIRSKGYMLVPTAFE